jgi:predicted RND superfamily exporter protein
MEAVLGRYFAWVTRRPGWVLLACAGLTAVLAGAAARVRVYVDIDANLPANHPYVRADREIQADFGGRNIVAIAIHARQGSMWSPEGLSLLVRLTRDVSALPDVVGGSVLSLASPKAKDIRGTEEGLTVVPILAEPPANAAEVEAVRAAFERNRSTLGPLVADHGRAAVIFFEFADGVSDDEAHRRVGTLLEKIRGQAPGFDLFVTGRPMFGYAFTRNARRAERSFLLAAAAIMATLWLSFGSLQGMLVPIGTGLLSTVWGLGMMGLAGVHMDGWNAVTPVLILAIAAGHSVQILKRYYEEYERLAAVPDLRERSRRAVVESGRRTGLVMLVAGSVAAGGFASLAVFGIPTIRDFGVFTALGVLSAVVLELTFVPAARTRLPPPRPSRRRGAPIDRGLDAFGRALRHPASRIAVYAATAAVVATSALFATRIEINNSVRDYLAADDPARVGSEVLEQELGGIAPCFVLVDGGKENALLDPALLRWMAALEEELRQVESVRLALSLADVVRRLHQAMHGDDPAYDRIPESRNLIAQYFLLYSLSADPEDFSRFATADYSRGVIRATLRSDQSRDVETAVEAIEGFARRVPPPVPVRLRIGGSGPIALAVDRTLTEGKLLNIGLVLLMVYVLSSVVLGSPFAGAFVVLPLIVAVVANFGALGAFGLWLNMGTATIAAMAVGIGADYAIYFAYRLREEYARLGDEAAAVGAAIATSGKAVFFVAVAISVGYGTLAFSDFYLNRVLARLVPLTMAVSALVALTLLPAAFLELRPRFVFARGQPGARRARVVAPGPAARRPMGSRSVPAGLAAAGAPALRTGGPGFFPGAQTR